MFNRNTFPGPAWGEFASTQIGTPTSGGVFRGAPGVW